MSANWTSLGFSLRGVTGADGLQGPVGPQGPQGATGANGTGLRVLGSLPDTRFSSAGDPLLSPGNNTATSPVAIGASGTNISNETDLLSYLGATGTTGTTNVTRLNTILGYTAPNLALQGGDTFLVRYTPPSGSETTRMYTWTGIKWLDAGVIGAVGIQGATGVGVAGPAGPSGAAGARGETGPAGARGSEGARGEVGADGRTFSELVRPDNPLTAGSAHVWLDTIEESPTSVTMNYASKAVGATGAAGYNQSAIISSHLQFVTDRVVNRTVSGSVASFSIPQRILASNDSIYAGVMCYDPDFDYSLIGRSALPADQILGGNRARHRFFGFHVAINDAVRPILDDNAKPPNTYVVGGITETADLNGYYSPYRPTDIFNIVVNGPTVSWLYNGQVLADYTFPPLFARRFELSRIAILADNRNTPAPLGTRYSINDVLYYPTGLEGLQGEMGPQGPQGVAGPQGPQGIQGLQGTDGQRGATGADGPRGLPGAVGLGGAAGAAGATGDAGSAIFTNIGAPDTVAPLLGKVGDMYINLAPGADYGVLYVKHALDTTSASSYRWVRTLTTLRDTRNGPLIYELEYIGTATQVVHRPGDILSLETVLPPMFFDAKRLVDDTSITWTVVRPNNLGFSPAGDPNNLYIVSRTSLFNLTGLNLNIHARIGTINSPASFPLTFQIDGSVLGGGNPVFNFTYVGSSLVPEAGSALRAYYELYFAPVGVTSALSLDPAQSLKVYSPEHEGFLLAGDGRVPGENTVGHLVTMLAPGFTTAGDVGSVPAGVNSTNMQYAVRNGLLIVAVRTLFAVPPFVNFTIPVNPTPGALTPLIQMRR